MQKKLKRTREHTKNFQGSWFWVCCDAIQKKEYFMSLDWNLIWKILQLVALLIIAREIDKRIRKRKKQLFMKKPEKSKGVWYLALVAFFITIFVIGYFS